MPRILDQYWHVTWSMNDAERLDQRIIDLPAVTLAIEAGDVPAPLVVTGVRSRAWRRTIEGNGRVFAIRPRPAGLAVLSNLTAADVADATMTPTAELDPLLHAPTQTIAVHPEPAERAHATNRAITEALAAHPATEG